MPMSPTVNQSYASRRSDGKTVITDKLSKYYKHVNQWYGLQNRQRHEAAHMVGFWLKQGHQIGVTCYFNFPYQRILNIEGRAKTLDHSNRVKSAHDSIAKNLWIDDREFFTEANVKTIGDSECIDVILNPVSRIDTRGIPLEGKVLMYRNLSLDMG